MKQICYVCGNEIKENPLYVCQGFYRHRSKCSPGSVTWLKSPIARLQQNREYSKIFKNTTKENK